MNWWLDGWERPDSPPDDKPGLPDRESEQEPTVDESRMPVSLRAALRGLINRRPPQRGTVKRVGERDQWPPHLRALVYMRDSGRCRICGADVSFKRAQLDHITPWSAGGSDAATNLRLAHDTCNADRSNYLDPEAEDHRPLPVTPLCLGCMREKPQLVKPTHPGFAVWAKRGANADESELVTAYCGRCQGSSPTPVWNTL